MSTTALRDFIAHHDDRWLFVAVYIGLAVVLSIVLSLFWLVAVAGLHFALEYLRQAQYRSGVVEIVSHALWEIKLDIALVLLALAMALYMEVILGVLGLQSAARATAATRVTRFAAWERNLRAVVLLADDVARVVQIGVTRALRRRGGAGAAVQSRAANAVAATASVSAAADTRATVTAGAPRDSGAVRAAASSGAASSRVMTRGGGERGPSARARGGADGSRGGVAPTPPAAAPPRGWRDRWTRGDRFVLALLAGCMLAIVLAPVLTDQSWSGATVTLLEQLHPFPPR